LLIFALGFFIKWVFQIVFFFHRKPQLQLLQVVHVELAGDANPTDNPERISSGSCPYAFGYRFRYIALLFSLSLEKKKVIITLNEEGNG